MPSKSSAVPQLARATQFERALWNMQDKSVSLSRTGAAFGVSKTSFHRRATGAVPANARKGRHAIVSSQDEAGIVKVILLRSKHRLCMTDNELRILAIRVAIEKHGTIPDSLPSKMWCLRIIKRHGDVITRKRSQILDAKCYGMSTEEHLRDYHANLQDTMQELLPGQVWNCDETRFCPQGNTKGYWTQRDEGQFGSVQ
ncbi:hypothetical protein DVH05_014035 [Phytophthora capsici]|nr:hypothetical protein DVH05_014035 [Phytophthora capsici]